LPSAILRRYFLALVAAASVGCAGAPKPPVAKLGDATVAPASPAPVTAPDPEPPRAPDAVLSGLRFSVAPAEAEISIDGSPRGVVADLADRGGLLPLAPGIYQVSLKAPGYVTWRAEVALRSGTESIRVNLTPRP